jgi:hypothetical protein
MRKVPLQQGRRGSVDLCEHCGGAYLSFFAGEPMGLSRQLERHVESFVDLPRKRAVRPLMCPDCGRIMQAHPYLDVGPEIARCGACLAVFATAKQVRELSRFRLIRPDPSWIERLAAWLRRLLDRLTGRAPA